MLFGRSPDKNATDPKDAAKKAAKEASGGKAVESSALLEGVYTTEQADRPYKALGAVSVRMRTINSPASFEEAARALLAAAQSYGADAVVAVRYEAISEPPALNMHWYLVHAYGTAVKFD